MEFANLERDALVRSEYDEESMDVFEWNFIAASAFLTEGYQGGYAKEEVLRGYMTSVKILYDAFYKRSHPAPYTYELYNDQSYIPLLFLCRHTLELAVKYLYGISELPEPTGHRIRKLWRELEPNLTLPLEDREGIGVFLDVIDLLDQDGCHMRYATDRNNEPYQKEPLYVRIDGIVDLTCQFTAAALQKNWM